MLYFDHNATTFLAPEVAAILNSASLEVYGNPSSTHRVGQTARHALEESRSAIARFIQASSAEMVLTSGGTESNNLAILGLVRGTPGKRKHVITTVIEHPSVLEPCRQLECEGVDVSYVSVDGSGLVNPDEIWRNISPETVLISVMHANNETGAIQPIRKIACLVEDRRRAGQNVFFHSDGVQALGKIDANVRELGVDLYSMSAHKVFAPKGIGALFVRKGTPLCGLQHGGRHERGRRGGTENVPGAMAFARAVKLCDASGHQEVAALRERFETAVISRVDAVKINGPSADGRLPNTSNLLFHGVSAEALVIALDMQGMAVSTGSACSSGSVEPSHVLLAMGRSQAEARSSVRFSFGRYNTADEIDTLIEAVVVSVARLRNTTRLEKRVAV